MMLADRVNPDELVRILGIPVRTRRLGGVPARTTAIDSAPADHAAKNTPVRTDWSELPAPRHMRARWLIGWRQGQG
jgi:hypothetical protein